MSIDSSPMESNNVEKTVIPESSTQHNLGHPQRTRSWGRRRNSQVVVLVTSNESLYLVNEESLDHYSKPLKTISLPRTPWIQSQDVYVSDGHAEEQYVGTVKVNRIGRGMTWKRFTGSVKEMYVYDRPPRVNMRAGSMVPA